MEKNQKASSRRPSTLTLPLNQMHYWLRYELDQLAGPLELSDLRPPASRHLWGLRSPAALAIERRVQRRLAAELRAACPDRDPLILGELATAQAEWPRRLLEHCMRCTGLLTPVTQEQSERALVHHLLPVVARAGRSSEDHAKIRSTGGVAQPVERRN